MNSEHPTLLSLFTIWIYPRRTIREIVDSGSGQWTIFLSVLYGFEYALSQASSRNLGDEFSLPALLLITVIGGALGGIISVYFMGALLRWTGSWLGGEALPEEVRAAYAWSAVPVIFSPVARPLPLTSIVPLKLPFPSAVRKPKKV